MRRDWIDGLLYPSLDLLARPLTPSLSMRADLVELHVGFVRVERTPTPVDDAFAAYEQAGGKLLVLGEPGSGKTTQLLRIAEALLSRADEDPQAEVPIVFHLRGWSAGLDSLDLQFFLTGLLASIVLRGWYLGSLRPSRTIRAGRYLTDPGITNPAKPSSSSRTYWKRSNATCGPPFRNHPSAPLSQPGMRRSSTN